MNMDLPNVQSDNPTLYTPIIDLNRELPPSPSLPPTSTTVSQPPPPPPNTPVSINSSSVNTSHLSRSSEKFHQSLRASKPRIHVDDSTFTTSDDEVSIIDERPASKAEGWIQPDKDLLEEQPKTQQRRRKRAQLILSSDSDSDSSSSSCSCVSSAQDSMPPPPPPPPPKSSKRQQSR